ncbi:MAG TPA: hypothetical protein PLI90_06020 [Rhodocyclaceae bacterium]|nr:hypothetical protein [Rhodocyclaceae bacterium]
MKKVTRLTGEDQPSGGFQAIRIYIDTLNIGWGRKKRYGNPPTAAAGAP